MKYKIRCDPEHLILAARAATRATVNGTAKYPYRAAFTYETTPPVTMWSWVSQTGTVIVCQEDLLDQRKKRGPYSDAQFDGSSK